MNSHYWESNLLWSLKEFNDLNKPLVLWDMVAAMLAFKQSMPEFVELVLTKWLYVSYLGFHDDIPMEDLVPKISKRFPTVPSRLLHILNVISRRVMLSELKTEDVNRKLRGQRTNNEEEIDLWLKLLEESERELRERLVGLSFSAYLIAQWRPAGLAQLQQWVELNHDIVHKQLETLSMEVKSSLTRSSNSEGTALEEEKCPYCQNKKKLIARTRGREISTHQKKLIARTRRRVKAKRDVIKVTSSRGVVSQCKYVHQLLYGSANAATE